MDNQRLRGGRFAFLSAPLLHLSNNAFSLCGVVLVTSAGVLWLLLLPIYIHGFVGNPYAGILLFLVLPTAFFLGLALIPAGIYWRRRRSRAPAGNEFPLAWSNPDLRRLVYFVGVTTFANLVIGVQLTYRAVDYMDSVTFCGLTCHRIMRPEYTAYQGSPHSRVECVQCHIGPGASWFVRSKLSGVQQVFNYALNTYPRPIPTPVHNLRPARETCEACHWPERFDGDRLRIITKAGEDEKNTLTKTVLLMHIGGGTGGPGIHGRHIGRGVQVEYAYSDPARQAIPWVRYRGADGKFTVFSSGDLKPGAEKSMEHRVMDCIDCHNRPTHTYQLPDRALDEALSTGRIPQNLPFLRKEGLAILKTSYKSRDEAQMAIPIALASYYQKNYPELTLQQRAEIRRAGLGILNIYNRNVFPEMRISWGTYPNNLGHVDFPGCFRCHDGSHASASGDTVTQDCEACHHVLAVDEASPKVLADLGVVAQ